MKDNNQQSSIMRFVGYTSLLLGLGFFAYALAAKWLYVPHFKAVGYEFIENSGGALAVLFALWMGSLPIGMMFLLIGMGLQGVEYRGRLIAGGIGLFVALFIVSIVQLRNNTPAFFGIGGLLIEVCFLLLVYFWYKVRAGVAPSKKLAVDVRFFGYALLATGVWFSCGIGGMPTLALYPEKMMSFGTHEGLVGLLSMMMIYFVVGWALTALSYFLELRAG
jgi:hypothetical protein